ncbi:hypothetical protein HL42_8019 [Trichophyton rubrum]|nr:hypothetical protein HL42_8019 [Trichophyton rubrum]
MLAAIRGRQPASQPASQPGSATRGSKKPSPATDERLHRPAPAQRPVARLAVDVDLLGHRGIAVAIAIVIAIAIARRRWSLVWSCVSGLELASSASLNVVPTPGAKSFAARGPGLRPLRQGSS